MKYVLIAAVISYCILLSACSTAPQVQTHAVTSNEQQLQALQTQNPHWAAWEVLDAFVLYLMNK